MLLGAEKLLKNAGMPSHCRELDCHLLPRSYYSVLAGHSFAHSLQYTL
jgi:hypothetical protein